jgi:hypothetical protein
MDILTGSICLSNIPREQMKKVMCKDGIERIFINIAVIERKEKGQYGDTHFVSCAPKKDERKDGVNYVIGDLKRYEPQPSSPTPEQINAAPPISPSDDLPF